MVKKVSGTVANHSRRYHVLLSDTRSESELNILDDIIRYRLQIINILREIYFHTKSMISDILYLNFRMILTMKIFRKFYGFFCKKCVTIFATQSERKNVIIKLI